MTYFTSWGYFDLWHYLVLGISLASFVTGIYFKINAQKKLALLFLGAFVLTYLFQIDLYNMWIMFIAIVIWIIGFIIVNNIFHNRRM